MSCCGQQRAEYLRINAGGANAAAAVHVSYGGVRTILVRGEATGSLYRFVPGSSLQVHGADALYMRAIPGLRQGDPSL
jgi:hypothetical protein